MNAADTTVLHDRHTTVGRSICRLSRAAGSVSTGLRLSTALPGMLNAPPHCHSAEEELFVVVAGAGSVLLGDSEHPLRPGHVVARPAGTGVAHAFRGGPDGITVLMYGTRDPNDICFYPRSGKVLLRGVGWWRGCKRSTTGTARSNGPRASGVTRGGRDRFHGRGQPRSANHSQVRASPSASITSGT
ncbi:MAG TPA: cupin domain-containing protein [Gaiellales bacterium]|nr:cupin domain-containing protein [Gaiellales bacterium]